MTWRENGRVWSEAHEWERNAEERSARARVSDTPGAHEEAAKAWRAAAGAHHEMGSPTKAIRLERTAREHEKKAFELRIEVRGHG